MGQRCGVRERAWGGDFNVVTIGSDHKEVSVGREEDQGLSLPAPQHHSWEKRRSDSEVRGVPEMKGAKYMKCLCKFKYNEN